MGGGETRQSFSKKSNIPPTEEKKCQIDIRA